MDFKDDGNGEGLFGARNENSVLFSLDSLTALDKSSTDNSAGSGLSTSGDASGLIDLNTLANMSSSGRDDVLGDGEPVMESVVFNQVVTKKKKMSIAIIVAVFIVVIGAGVGVALWLMNSAEEAATAQAAAQEELKKQQAEDAEKADAQIKALKQQLADAEAQGKRREADQAAVEAELKKLNEQKAALIANGAGDADKAGAKKSDGKKSDSKAGAAPAGGAADAAPAPAKKAPDKNELVNALQAANTKAKKCGKGGNLTVQFNLSNNTAKGVKAVGGTFAGSATEKCILTVVEKNNWPDGTASGIKYTFKM